MKNGLQISATDKVGIIVMKGIKGGQMLRTVLLSKIHQAVVTQTDLNYVGSITIDSALLAVTGMREFEKVEIFDINNGNRFETYIIAGEPGSGIIGINGAAARLVALGDRVIIVNYGLVTPEELEHNVPTVVIVDSNNRVVEEKLR